MSRGLRPSKLNKQSGCKRQRKVIALRNLIFTCLSRLAIQLITITSFVVFANVALATGYSLEFEELGAFGINDAASRFYNEIIGQWPTALRRTIVGTRAEICSDGLIVEMLDQKNQNISPWVVVRLSCPAAGSSTTKTLTLIAKRDIWKQCCTGVQDPERDWTALTFIVKGGTLIVRPTINGFELEHLNEELKSSPRVGKF